MKQIAHRAALAALVVLAACSDGGGVTLPPADPAPAAPLAAVSCTASVGEGRVQCGDVSGPAGIRARIIGGQHVNVLVSSANAAYDSAKQEFSFDVNVQNLLVQRMGSDGVTVAGLKVFFASGPNTTSGEGVGTVANADGMDAFTGSLQPYFHYPEALGPQAVSAARHWVLSIPKTVKTFAFTLYISAPLVPVIVFEMWPGGNYDVYRMGIDGNDLVKLSTSAASDATPTVAQGTVVFSSYRNGNAELYSVPLAGGAETRLTTSTTVQETSPALSPDGTKLAWVAGSGSGLSKVWTGSATATGGSAAAGGFADGIQSSPNWASSTRLAFTMANASSADVYDLTLGGAPTLLAGGSTAEVEPAWSPDGSTVAFASNRTGDTDLYLLNVGTGVVTRLTTRSGSDGAPTWLADGRIVFTCITGVQFHLCLVDPASPGTVTTIPTPNEADHAWAVRF
ncbi:MAG: TolB family protein [Longimicrobiaceae bacterium]